MKVVSIVIFVALAMFVVWFTYDTVKYCIKKHEEKKKRKLEKQAQEIEEVKEIDTTNKD